MQRVDGRLLFSATDLINHLECEHLSWLDLEAALGRLEPASDRPDATDLVARKGDEHEQAYLELLVSEGREVERIGREDRGESLAGAAQRTVEAMRAGAEVIYQGALFDGVRWRGYSDFLFRVSRPSELGQFSYEVGDTKLARRIKPYFLLQLCFYSELLEQVQGIAPDWMHVVLGTKESHAFRLADFAAYYRRVKRGFEDLPDAGEPRSYPEPVEHCGVCRWHARCSERWEEDDHLSLVARIRASQRIRLIQRGITTVRELAVAAAAERPPRIGEEPFAALREQARLQVLQRDTGELHYELLEPEDGQGFARLPEPSPGDVFFDMEGDPFFDDGLEYLFGLVTFEGKRPEFQAFWATDRAGEKQAFEDFIDFAAERWRRFPDMHIYHYASYEASALKRLMGLHATREEEVDDLLRGKVLVDLYTVVRQAVRISQPNYSIKSVEAFYMGARDTEVGEGGESIIAFEEYLETGNEQLLEAIERYNEDDCRSTHLLREWLLERRTEASETFNVEIPWKPPLEAWQPDPEVKEELDELQQALTGGVPVDVSEQAPDEHARWLMAQLLDYHRREANPGWWAYFERLEADQQQLTELDSEALGSLADTGKVEALPPPSRSAIHTLRFPPQEHKMGAGTFVDPQMKKNVSVEWLDDETGTLAIRRAAKRSAEPLPKALIPGKPYDTTRQRGALRELARDIVQRGLDVHGRYSVLRQVLRRQLPRVLSRPPGQALQSGSFDLEDAEQIAEALDGSYLFIQGPPGSGKTYTGAHLILHLIEAGHRVGVAANSHAAIHNLLNAVEKQAAIDTSIRGVKKTSGGEDSEYQSTKGLIENSSDLNDFTSDAYNLAAGTAWLFCEETLDQSLDYLVIDEAGQISLADALAMGTCARNLILLGDPQQLAQVSQAIHPPGASASVLEHLLGEHSTIPPERGLFIDRTRRMHPDVCRFISQAIYENRLESMPECAHQRIDAPGALTGTGVRYIAAEHEGNVRSSPEEAQAIAALVEDLLQGEYLRTDAVCLPLEASQIMVVAPYNAQVRCLREHLPADVKVGTVDRFQGQEAAVCFFSMATSSGVELPRNLEFLFSRNRLNVAISRARCLAVLVCNPELLHVRCRSAEQMRLLNALCWFVEMASEN